MEAYPSGEDFAHSLIEVVFVQLDNPHPANVVGAGILRKHDVYHLLPSLWCISYQEWDGHHCRQRLYHHLVS